MRNTLNVKGRSMSFITFLQHLLAVADRYVVEKLKSTCENELAGCLSLDSVLSTVLELAEKHNCSELKKGYLQFIVKKVPPLLCIAY